ncbi:MAG: HAMP domain-containing protein [Desulfuromonadales bacterium]|nr:HAMP domain-containing protein [Desulfuromonadales bacterium]
MLKSINCRAILPVACAVTGFVIACCLLLYSFIKSDLIRGEIEHAADLADTVVKSARYAMLNGDRETLRHIIRNVGEQQQVEHVRIFNKKGLIMFSEDDAEINRFIDKTAAGCNSCHVGSETKRRLGTMAQARQFTNADGHDVLAITTPIYNAPDCYTAACHVHDPKLLLLGTLDIGLSQAPLKRTMGMLQDRMIVFTGMILVLTVGVVCALLYRHVLMPIRKLVDFTEKQGNVNLDHEIPEVSGDMARLAKAFQKMARRLREMEGRDPDKT